VAESLDLAVYPIARAARQRYPMANLGSLITEAQWWIELHPQRVESTLEDGEALRKAVGLLAGHVQTKALHQHAKACGWEARDNYYFGLDVIANTIPGLFSDQYQGVMEEREEVRSNRDAAEGNNWPALLGDVGTAFKRCSQWSKGVLFDAYVLGLPISTDDVDQALREVRDLLGGSHPQGCNKDCQECGHG
jgi:hypothetical protein